MSPFDSLTPSSALGDTTQTPTSNSSAASTSGTTAILVNPYMSKRKHNDSTAAFATSADRSSTSTTAHDGSFIGGAEAARRKARQKRRHRPATQILRPGEQKGMSNATKRETIDLPHSMNTFERFFAALLRSPVEDFTSSNNNSSSSNTALWSTICRRVGLSIPTQPLKCCYEHDVTMHFAVRAALVLEEARHAIAASIQNPSFIKGSQNRHPSAAQGSNHTKTSSLQMQCHVVKPCNAHGHTVVTFAQQQQFTAAELYNIRPGAIVQCTRLHFENNRRGHVGKGSNGRSSNSGTGAAPPKSMMGVIAPSNRESVATSKAFSVMFFQHDDWTNTSTTTTATLDNAFFTVTITTQLVTQLRCFEAMTMVQPERSILFLHALMGNKSAVHTRFDSSDGGDNDDDIGSEKTEKACARDYALASVTPSPRATTATIGATGTSDFTESSFFSIPPLNAVQENAAQAYLRSLPNTLTLVQGPPGTGKTTLLVAILCRYVTEAMERGEQCRIMVSAPTNQAVSVLAARFLATVKHDAPTFCKTILVGDADKLVGNTTGTSSDDPRNNGGLANFDTDAARLRSVFLFKWIPAVMEGYEYIRHQCSRPFSSPAVQCQHLYQLAYSLQRRLTSSLPHLSADVLKWTERISASLHALQQGVGRDAQRHAVVSTVAPLLKFLREMPSDAVWTQLLLTANVIFCTLASAGNTVMRRTARIDDLIVDEAAAATEPELCIPFHLRPRRLLAVGDPLQLPATVLARRAEELGLAKSLHERLMYECDFDHVMLNVQYRMSCQISSFPSTRFYKSQIGNGPNVSGPLYLHGAPLRDRLPYCFLQVDGAEEQAHGGSYCNRAEAHKVADLVVELQQVARRLESADNTAGSWHSADRIRVITFYQAQVSMIKRCLHDRGLGNMITVATVDSSQGCEADVVILSFVRSPNPMKWTKNNASSTSSSSAGFLTDDRRMNVALTRAKYQLLCVGNVQYFGRSNTTAGQGGTAMETLHLLAHDVTQRGLVRTDCPLPLGGGGPGGRNNANGTRERLDNFYSLSSSPTPAPNKRFRSGY